MYDNKRFFCCYRLIANKNNKTIELVYFYIRKKFGKLKFLTLRDYLQAIFNKNYENSLKI
jgi:hypothetical protein